MKLGQRQITFGAFCISALVHFAILLIIGGLVLIEVPLQHETPVGTLDAAPPGDLPPEEAKPDSAPAEPAPPEPEQQPNVTQNLQPDAPNIITSTAVSPDYTMVAGAGPIVSGMPVATSPGQGGNSGNATGQKAPHVAVGNPFGGSQVMQDALIGTLYDFKQTKSHTSLPITNDIYCEIISKYINSHWNEAGMNKYFQSPRPLYNTQIFIPRISAGEGPMAFGVEQLVNPNFYAIHYKAHVAPPEDGTYRFVGFGDNIMVVAVNGKTVLMGNLKGYDPLKISWNPPSPPEGALAYEGANRLFNGNWIPLTAGEGVDLDILIGESYGGTSGYFLMIQKQGVTYPKDKEGQPILPIFQLDSVDVPPIPEGAIHQNGPEFSAGTPWKTVQVK